MELMKHLPKLRVLAAWHPVQSCERWQNLQEISPSGKKQEVVRCHLPKELMPILPSDLVLPRLSYRRGRLIPSGSLALSPLRDRFSMFPPLGCHAPHAFTGVEQMLTPDISSLYMLFSLRYVVIVTENGTSMIFCLIGSWV